MTALFSVAILCVTLCALTLRLTVLADMAVSNGPAASAPAEQQEEDGSLFPFDIARSVRFATPDSRGDFRINNPETNEYYMSVSIILPETGEYVFYTGIIRPGQSRGEARLQMRLPEGVYECIARVTALDPETLQPRGSVERSITLYIG